VVVVVEITPVVDFLLLGKMEDPEVVGHPVMQEIQTKFLVKVSIQEVHILVLLDRDTTAVQVSQATMITQAVVVVPEQQVTGLHEHITQAV
jgi:hypothetical protein